MIRRYRRYWLPLLASVIFMPASPATELKVDLIQLHPWAMPNPDKSSEQANIGIVVDLLRELEKRSAYRTQKILAPYARVEHDLESGEIDFAIMAWGDARARYANRGTAFVPLDFGVRAKKGVVLRRYDDLKQFTTSATRGLKIDPRFDADDGLKKDMVLDYTMGVKKTALNRESQAVAGSLSTINHIIRDLQLDDKFGDTLVFRTTYLTVAYSKKSPHSNDEQKINALFQTMVDEGVAQRIYSKWMNAKDHFLDMPERPAQ